MLRTYKDGQAKLNGYLEDYAFYADGLLALYEATFEVRWFAAARGLADTMLAQFADEEGGGFFDTSADHEALLTRPKDLYDNATPSGNSVATDVLLKLGEYTAEQRYREPAERLLAGLRDAMAQHPTAFGHLLCALDLWFSPPRELAVVGPPDSDVARAALEPFDPNAIVAFGPAEDIPLLEGKGYVDGKPAVYVCERFACRAPVVEPRELPARASSFPA